MFNCRFVVCQFSGWAMATNVGHHYVFFFFLQNSLLKFWSGYSKKCWFHFFFSGFPNGLTISDIMFVHYLRYIFSNIELILAIALQEPFTWGLSIIIVKKIINNTNNNPVLCHERNKSSKAIILNPLHSIIDVPCDHGKLEGDNLFIICRLLSRKWKESTTIGKSAWIYVKLRYVILFLICRWIWAFSMDTHV